MHHELTIDIQGWGRHKGCMWPELETASCLAQPRVQVSAFQGAGHVLLKSDSAV